MQSFAMLTRLAPDALKSPATIELLEHRVVAEIRRCCPTVKWIGNYAVMGPWDYLDLFQAPDLDEATKVAALVRSFGHAQIELWPLTEWHHFKDIVHQLPGSVLTSANA